MQGGLSIIEDHFGYQPFRFSKSSFSQSYLSFGIPKHSPWKDEVTSVLGRLHQGGIPNHLMER